MRLSELAGKRIINLYDGEIIGTAGDSDLLIDSVSGLITEIIIPPGRNPAAARRRATYRASFPKKTNVKPNNARFCFSMRGFNRKMPVRTKMIS